MLPALPCAACFAASHVRLVAAPLLAWHALTHGDPPARVPPPCRARRFLTKLRADEYRGSFEAWLTKRSRQREVKRKELRRWRQAKESEARKQRVAEREMAPLAQLEEQIEAIFGQAQAQTGKPVSVNAAVSKLRMSADRELYANLAAAAGAGAGSGSGVGAGARQRSASDGDSDGEVDYEALLGDGGGGGDGDGGGAGGADGAGAGAGAGAHPQTRLVSRRVFNEVLQDVLTTLAADKRAGIAAQRMLDPASGRKRELAAHLRTKAGRRELKRHLQTVRDEAEAAGVTLTKRQMAIRARRLLRKSLDEQARQSGLAPAFLPAPAAMEKASEVGSKAQEAAAGAFAYVLVLARFQTPDSAFAAGRLCRVRLTHLNGSPSTCHPRLLTRAATGSEPRTRRARRRPKRPRRRARRSDGRTRSCRRSGRRRTRRGRSERRGASTTRSAWARSSGSPRSRHCAGGPSGWTSWSRTP